jgi:hypothetical protein
MKAFKAAAPRKRNQEKIVADDYSASRESGPGVGRGYGLSINKSPVSHVKDMIFAYNAPSRPEGCDFGDMREGRNTSKFFSP